MRLTTVALSGFFISCGCQTVWDTQFIDAPLDLKFHTMRFLDNCDKYNKRCKLHNLKLMWVDELSDNRVGECRISWEGFLYSQEIRISRKTNPSTVDMVIMHELTHCVRFVDHHPGDIPHIMRSYDFTEYELTQKPRQEWIKEVFDWNKKSEGFKHHE